MINTTMISPQQQGRTRWWRWRFTWYRFPNIQLRRQATNLTGDLYISSCCLSQSCARSSTSTLSLLFIVGDELRVATPAPCPCHAQGAQWSTRTRLQISRQELALCSQPSRTESRAHGLCTQLSDNHAMHETGCSN